MRSGLTPSIGDVGAAESRWRGLAEPDPISSLAHICQVSDAGPGTYYLLLECRQKLNNLGLTLTLGDTDYLRCKKIQLPMLETICRRMEELKNGQLDVTGMEHINEIDI